MKHLSNYINIRKRKSTIKATDKTIKQIVKDELDRLGHDCDLNHIDVSEVTNMYGLFSCYHKNLGSTYNDLNPDISKWDVSSIVNMNWMFRECKKFNCDISGWVVSKVKYMNRMFLECKKFNQDLSGWDVSNVNNFEGMFDYCPIREEFKPKFK